MRVADGQGTLQGSAWVEPILLVELDKLLGAVGERHDDAASACDAITACCGLLHSALEAEEAYKKLSFTWMSLEGLFANFAFEDEQYRSRSPISFRIGYRAATTIAPTSGWIGRTYGEFRTSVTAELQGLYALRCRAVHEGQVSPSLNHWLWGRWKDYAVNACLTVANAVLYARAKSVEEVVAFYEKRFPNNAPIKGVNVALSGG